MSAPNKDLRLVSKVELPRGEEGIWMMIQKLSELGSWSIADLATFAGNRPNVVRDYVMRLVKAGYVRVLTEEKKRTTRGTATLFEQAKPSVTAPRVFRNGTVMPELKIETMWRTMRMLKRFTIPEVADYISTPEEPANKKTVSVYVCELTRVGILLCERGCQGGHGLNTYRLVRPLGPRAPRILQARIIFDPNAKATVGVAATQEAAL